MSGDIYCWHRWAVKFFAVTLCVNVSYFMNCYLFLALMLTNYSDFFNIMT